MIFLIILTSCITVLVSRVVLIHLNRENMSNPQGNCALSVHKSSIDTLDKTPPCTIKSSIFSNRTGKSIQVYPMESETEYGELSEGTVGGQQIPESLMETFLKGVKLTETERIYENPLQYAEEIVTAAIFECQSLLETRNYRLHTDCQIPPNIAWPTKAEFTIFHGLRKIDEYVQMWELHPDWKYLIELHKINEGPYGTEYVYEVRFSCPRPQFPVPQATASVYFHILFSTSSPWNSQVQVGFTVESMETMFQPGRVIFNQKWLEIVVDSKIHFFKQIRR